MFDRKFRGEICQFSPLKLPILSPKFAVKVGAIYKRLIFNNLQKRSKTARFVKYFYQFISMLLSVTKQDFLNLR